MIGSAATILSRPKLTLASQLALRKLASKIGQTKSTSKQPDAMPNADKGGRAMAPDARRPLLIVLLCHLPN